jgi:hypothetical protein
MKNKLSIYSIIKFFFFYYIPIMTDALPDPIPIIVGGGIPSSICDIDRDTCIKVEESPDDDHIRLIAKDTEVLTANENEVNINAGYIESAIDIVTDDTTFQSNQKIIKIDIDDDKIFTLPPCATNEGRQYSIVRIDANDLFTAIIRPTSGDKLNNVIDDEVPLMPGCHLTIQCVDGWFIGL